MKKIILLLTLVSAMSFSFAQEISFGVKGGVNFSSLTSSGSGITVTTSKTTGFHVGGFVDFGLGSWSIQPAILFTTKGGEQNFSGTSSFGTTTYAYSSSEKITLNYIEVPVNVLYHIPAGFGKIFLGGGPYVAYGISGTEKSSTSATGSASTSESHDVKYGSNSTDDIKNPDFGINVLGGIKLDGGLSFSLGYGFGLANLSTDSSSTGKNNSLSVSVGFSFL